MSNPLTRPKEATTVTHARAVQLLTRLEGRKTTNEPPVYFGRCYSQTYPSGPVEWLVSLHGDLRDEGVCPAQVTVYGYRDGTVEVVAEPRRNARTGQRMVPPAKLLTALTPVVEAVRAKVAA